MNYEYSSAEKREGESGARDVNEFDEFDEFDEFEDADTAVEMQMLAARVQAARHCGA